MILKKQLSDSSNCIYYMNQAADNLSKLAKIKLFQAFSGSSSCWGYIVLFIFNQGNGFVGRYICRIAAQCGLIPVSISVNPFPPVYSADDPENQQWVTRVYVLNLDSM